uniref:Protein lifeguard 2 n=1 Tax=Cyprinus carpio TaxID=7962 RepID=A0A8C1TCM6_CYPCA
LICLQVSVTNKSNDGSDVQPMASGPPSYEEATGNTTFSLMDFLFKLIFKNYYLRGSGSPCYSGAYPGDSEMLTEFSWDDQNIRRIFIRKVYTILMLQLSVTLAFVAVFIFCEPVKYYIQTNPGWYWASYVVFFVTYLTLSCCRGPRVVFLHITRCQVFDRPISYLNIFPLSSYYNTKSVVICLGITALVCLAITIFSFQTKIDITSYQGVLLVFCTVLFICGLVLAVILPFGYVPWLHAVYAALGAILFCMFLAFDTQMLMGKKQYTISPEEYIFATLSIYLDIVYIFTFLLQLFGTPERE